MAKSKTGKTDKSGLAASARKVWLAGLGALAEAEDRGDKFFKALVKKGKNVEPAFQEPFEAAGETLKESVAAARSSASKGVKELEGVIDRAVASAMKKAGLASSKDVEALRKEIAKLKREAKKSAASKRGNKGAKSKTGSTTKKKKKVTPTSTSPSP